MIYELAVQIAKMNPAIVSRDASANNEAMDLASPTLTGQPSIDQAKPIHCPMV